MFVKRHLFLYKQLPGETGQSFVSRTGVTHDIYEAVYLAERVILLGGIPAHALGEYPIKLSRPRHRDERRWPRSPRSNRVRPGPFSRVVLEYQSKN